MRTGILFLMAAVSGLARPNFLYILADDYGWANFGPHTSSDTPEARQRQQETRTPRMDQLVDEGVLLERHYTYKYCGPSRNSLQSGRLPVHVALENYGILTYNASDPVSGFGGIPLNMTTIGSKLQAAGYQTGMTGKWDAGMADPVQTPTGRGYEEWLGFYAHSNNAWSKRGDLTSTGETDVCLSDVFTDYSRGSKTYQGPVRDPAMLSTDCNTSMAPDPECFISRQLKDFALGFFDSHDPAQGPFFYFHSFHLVHTPLQVPLSYLKKIDELVDTPFDIASRRTLAAMIMYMDDAVGAIVDKLKEKGLYDNTIIVFSADNGGAIYASGGGNNWPLRGGKYSEFEGSSRVNAFMSGGYVPPAARGTKYHGLIALADWYGMFCELAGVDPFDQQAANINPFMKANGLQELPPVDSQKGLFDAIVANTPAESAPRQELHMTTQAMIKWPYKIITGESFYDLYGGEVFPNCTSGNPIDELPWYVDAKFFGKGIDLFKTPSEKKYRTASFDCGHGCLFNIKEDPNEREDLAASMPDKLKEMQAALKAANTKLFNPARGGDFVEACEFFIENELYSYGPFVGATDEFYTKVPADSATKEYYQKWMNRINYSQNNTYSLTGIYQNALSIPEVFNAMLSGSDACLAQDPDFVIGSVSQSKQIMPVLWGANLGRHPTCYAFEPSDACMKNCDPCFADLACDLLSGVGPCEACMKQPECLQYINNECLFSISDSNPDNRAFPCPCSQSEFGGTICRENTICVNNNSCVADCPSPASPCCFGVGVCDNQHVRNCVAGFDPFCATAWDDQCVQEAKERCLLTC